MSKLTRSWLHLSRFGWNLNGQIGITELCPEVENLEGENSHFADRAPAARVSAARFKKKLTRRRSGGVEAERLLVFLASLKASP